MTTRTAKLVCVAVDHNGTSNSNKFYNLIENTDGSLTAEYGRVGAAVNTVHYPAGKKNFDKILSEKRRKGYTDITSLKQTTTSSGNKGDIFRGVDPTVKTLLTFLMDSSRNKVSNNYLVTTDDVTKTQLDEAQSLIDKTISLLQKGGNTQQLNKLLMSLYTILPRQMKDVRHYLVDSLSTDRDLEGARKLIDSEQSLLSTLESQILSNTQTAQTIADEKNILEEMGIEINVVDDKEELDKIYNLLGDNKNYVKNIYSVVNYMTQKRFDEHVAKSNDKTTTLLFHGSRNENHIGILQQGLLIRPANAVITGAMFGNGAYTASSSQKSLGYTSLNGSYWARGNSNKGFLMLYDVHTGKQYHINKHDSSCYNLHNTIPQKGYDSVFAHKGADLRNDEFITYDIAKTTIKYLIEIEK